MSYSDMEPGVFLRHVKARQELMRVVLTIAAQELGGARLVSYAQLESAAAELTEAAAARAEAIKAQDILGRMVPAQVVHVGDADVARGGDHAQG